MIYPDFKEFKKLSKRGNIIPVYKELLADLETPVSAFLKMDKRSEYSYLLESVESQQTIGRYSFIAVDPSLVFESKNKRVTFTRFLKGQKRRRSYQCQSSPLDELRILLAGFKFVPVRGRRGFAEAWSATWVMIWSDFLRPFQTRILMSSMPLIAC